MVNNIITFLNAIMNDATGLLITCSAFAFIIGAFLHVMGGAEGLQKAKKWYFGSAVGLIIGLSAKQIVEMISSNLTF